MENILERKKEEKKLSWAKGPFAERGQDGKSIRVRQKKRRGGRKENPLTAPRFQLKSGGSSATTDKSHCVFLQSAQADDEGSKTILSRDYQSPCGVVVVSLSIVSCSSKALVYRRLGLTD